MKFVMFVGELAEHGLELIEHLKKDGFYGIKTVNVDEIDQLGRQAEKAILVFTDHKFAYRFLMENKWKEFPHMNILYLNRKPIITEEVQKKLSQVNLLIFLTGDKAILVDKINRFYTTGKDESTDGEIEFSVHEELGKKRA